MKIKLVAPKVNSGCGVADYTFELLKNLRNLELTSEIISIDRWCFFNIKELVNKISLKRNEILHIQYPSQPYGKSFLLNVVGIFYYKKFILTLHEYGEVHFLRKMAGFFLCFCSKKTIFTNHLDKEIFTKKFQFLKSKCNLIGIGSNIPLLGDVSQLIAGPTVVFFGLIRPNKGIEQFLELVNHANNSDLKLDFLIVGSRPKSNNKYFEEILLKIKSFNIKLYLDRNPQKVAEILMSANFAYLHYPDGASERRGSFLAALGNSLIVLSNTGNNTSTLMRDTYIPCENPLTAFLTIKAILDEKVSINLDVQYIDNYLKGRDWFTIAKLHKQLYESLERNLL